MRENKIELIKQYEETGKLLHTFFEWRYKVMNRFFLAIAAIFIAVQWMFKDPELRSYIFIPLLLGSIFSIFTAYMDRVNQRIMNTCYKVGEATEHSLDLAAGLYSQLNADFLNNRTRRIVSYRNILKILYWLSALTLFIGALLSIVLN